MHEINISLLHYKRSHIYFRVTQEMAASDAKDTTVETRKSLALKVTSVPDQQLNASTTVFAHGAPIPSSTCRHWGVLLCLLRPLFVSYVV